MKDGRSGVSVLNLRTGENRKVGKRMMKFLSNEVELLPDGSLVCTWGDSLVLIRGYRLSFLGPIVTEDSTRQFFCLPDGLFVHLKNRSIRTYRLVDDRLRRLPQTINDVYSMDYYRGLLHVSSHPMRRDTLYYPHGLELRGLEDSPLRLRPVLLGTTAGKSLLYHLGEEVQRVDLTTGKTVVLQLEGKVKASSEDRVLTETQTGHKLWRITETGAELVRDIDAVGSCPMDDINRELFALTRPHRDGQEIRVYDPEGGEMAKLITNQPSYFLPGRSLLLCGEETRVLHLDCASREEKYGPSAWMTSYQTDNTKEENERLRGDVCVLFDGLLVKDLQSVVYALV